MRPSAAFWSTTTLVVSGSFLPFAISDSRRSTRKMMSIGWPSCLGVPVDGSSRAPVARDYRHGAVGALEERCAGRPTQRGRAAGTIARHVAAERRDLLDQARAHVAVARPRS